MLIIDVEPHQSSDTWVDTPIRVALLLFDSNSLVTNKRMQPFAAFWLVRQESRQVLSMIISYYAEIFVFGLRENNINCESIEGFARIHLLYITKFVKSHWRCFLSDQAKSSKKDRKVISLTLEGEGSVPAITLSVIQYQ